MINLNVLSVNGDTALADATYSVSERRVYLGYEDPQNSSRTYVEIERPEGATKDVLLVDDTVANTITALNAGTLLEVFFAVTIKSRDEVQFGPAAGRSGFLNLHNIVAACDFNSDGNIMYASYNITGGDELIITDDAISAISSAAADISPGAETLPFPLTSKTCHRVGGIALPFPRVYLLNENYIQKVVEDFDNNEANERAEATAKLKVESIIAVAAGGTGYTLADVLTFVGGTGTAATVTVSAIAPITAQTEADYNNSPTSEGTFVGGAGHAVADVITLADGTTVTVDAEVAGVVTEFTVNSAASTGSGSHTIAQASTTGVGTGFQLVTDTANRRIYAVTLTTAGSYSVLMGTITAVAVTGGTGSGATFNVDFEVDSLVVSYSGSGYSSAPTVTISGGGGTGATATSTLVGDNVVSCTVTAPGNNFTSIPTVVIAAPTAKIMWLIGGDQGGAAKEYVF